MKLSVAFQTDKRLSAYGELARRVEGMGFEGVSVYNDLLFQPAWLPLLEMARATRRVRLGPAGVNPFTCHPINIAGNVALLDEASGGRAYLGMVRGAWLDFVGLEPSRPVQAMNEAMGAVRHLLRRDKSPLVGDFFPLAGGDSLRWAVARPGLPFMLGTWGPRTVGACIGQVAEVKLGGTANPAVAEWMLGVMAQAARGEGIDPAGVGLVVGAVTVLDEDRAAAYALAKREVALYLPVVAGLDPTISLEPELLGRLKAAAERYDFAAAAGLISDDLLRKFAFVGTPDEVVEQVGALAGAGVSRVEFGTPHGLTTQEGLRLLGSVIDKLVNY